MQMRTAAMVLSVVWLLAGCAAAAQRFFPEAPDFQEHWYGGQLQALHEKPLCCETGDHGRVIRFVWLRSFHHPVVIRLTERKPGSWRLVTKIGGGAAGYAPRGTLAEYERAVSSSEVAAVISQVDPTAQFWRMPSAEPPSRTCLPDKECLVEVHLDGAQWIIEVRDEARYHYVDRFSPEDGPIRELGARLMALSHQHFGPIY